MVKQKGVYGDKGRREGSSRHGEPRVGLWEVARGGLPVGAIMGEEKSKKGENKQR